MHPAPTHSKPQHPNFKPQTSMTCVQSHHRRRRHLRPQGIGHLGHHSRNSSAAEGCPIDLRVLHELRAAGACASSKDNIDIAWNSPLAWLMRSAGPVMAAGPSRCAIRIATACPTCSSAATRGSSRLPIRGQDRRNGREGFAAGERCSAPTCCTRRAWLRDWRRHRAAFRRARRQARRPRRRRTGSAAVAPARGDAQAAGRCST